MGAGGSPVWLDAGRGGTTLFRGGAEASFIFISSKSSIPQGLEAPPKAPRPRKSEVISCESKDKRKVEQK